MTPAQILERLRVLFGIPADDETHDAELQALFDTALAAARTYTHRWLYPLADFRETFHAPANYCSPCSCCCPVVVSELPVAQVVTAKRDGTDLDAAALVVALWGGVYERAPGGALMPLAPFTVLELTYKAGYTDLPADLAEALCQVAAAAGSASVVAAGGAPQSASVKKRTVFDVGAVEYATAQGAFFAGEVTPTQLSGAILGPWASTLDAYRDMAKTLGGDDCIHELVKLPPAPARAEANA